MRVNLAIPKRLASQMILLVLITLFGTQLMVFTIFALETDNKNVVTNKIYTNHYFERTVAAVKALENGSSRASIYALNSYQVKYFISDKPTFNHVNMSEADKARIPKLREELGGNYPNVYLRQFEPMENRLISAAVFLKNQLLTLSSELPKQESRSIILQSQVQIKDGRWLTLTVYDLNAFPLWIHSTVMPTIIFTLIFMVFAIFIVKRITSPLSELADKANLLGKGHKIEEIEPRGPEDVEKAIIAFNTMRKRLLSVHGHRAKALAAISHDIRTPLTAMRLNAEYINDMDVKEKMLKKIEEMEQICEATVTFALKDSWSEKSKQFDLLSLVESLCCDLMEQNIDVTFIDGNMGKIPFTGRPIAIKRAITNLIKNGVTYGNKVEVSIIIKKDAVEIHILDNGPGIPNTEKERIFEPFERIEESRSRSSGGLGLGMAIARSAIRSHGGEIELVNKKDKGLDVIVILPL